MPSAEETTYLIGVMPDGAAQADAFLTRDVDLLVSQIKENLRLSSLKAKSSVSHKNNRPSPYRIPRSWADPAAGCEVCGLRSSGQSHHQQQQVNQVTAGHHHHYHSHLKRTERNRVDDDPYEMLQELLREGGLIKEAVKRLQANLDELSSSEVDEDEEVDDEDDERRSSNGGGYRRKPYFYDSEDEPLPPMYEPLEL
ncbi:glycogen synthase kinase-3 binding domain-containing protein [Lasius niger]|uniref:Glycogen synthase kinase-3 binding domain-containing protein n=1 Tax=Lasius niger TaxID=67767 RepID=A0A0J7KWF6_LASNI|nr:glycogen synthase kinase-3 binding domain-containing protein [Lasius niger]